MIRFIDFTLPSTVPGRTLHGFRCVPEGQVRAVLQLSHGMVEFIDRYRPLAEYLADRGILVTGQPGLDIEKDILAHMDFKPIIKDVKVMDERIFKDELMGLAK